LGDTLRFHAGEWRCRNCGAVLARVPQWIVPRTVFVDNDGRPTVRVIEVDDREIHRCALRDKPALAPPPPVI
jgi:hypothetical protein